MTKLYYTHTYIYLYNQAKLARKLQVHSKITEANVTPWTNNTLNHRGIDKIHAVITTSVENYYSMIIPKNMNTFG